MLHWGKWVWMCCGHTLRIYIPLRIFLVRVRQLGYNNHICPFNFFLSSHLCTFSSSFLLELAKVGHWDQLKFCQEFETSWYSLCIIIWATSNICFYNLSRHGLCIHMVLQHFDAKSSLYLIVRNRWSSNTCII
jgi:hypothetical protein